MKQTINTGMIALGMILANSGVQAGTITTYTDRPTFNAAVGSTTTDDFGPSFAFPISTGVLDSTTNLATSSGGPILPGLIQPGVTYSTPVGSGNFFNIDFGGGYAGGFLDGFEPSTRDLTISFNNSVAAFGFDIGTLGASTFDVTIQFASGPNQIFNNTYPAALSFFGFQSSASDINSVILSNNGAFFGFDLDNFSVGGNPVGQPSVPETSTMLLFGSGLAGLVMWRRKKSMGSMGSDSIDSRFLAG